MRLELESFDQFNLVFREKNKKFSEKLIDSSIMTIIILS